MDAERMMENLMGEYGFDRDPEEGVDTDTEA